MEIENQIRYTALAVGLKPSATGCEARLRGLSSACRTLPFVDSPDCLLYTSPSPRDS